MIFTEPEIGVKNTHTRQKLRFHVFLLRIGHRYSPIVDNRKTVLPRRTQSCPQLEHALGEQRRAMPFRWRLVMLRMT